MTVAIAAPTTSSFNTIINIVINQYQSSPIKLAIYDIKGRELEILFDGIIQSEKSSYTWNATIYPTGIYFIKAICKNQRQVKKIMLVK